MKWQGRTGLLVGVALVVAAGLVVTGKKTDSPEIPEPSSEASTATVEKGDPPGAVPVSRPGRNRAPGVRP